MIIHRKQQFVSGIVLALGLCIAQAADREWIPLIKRESLNGWHTLPGGKWELKDGVVTGTSDKSEPRHGLLVTDRQFSDFEAKAKFRVLEGDSGFYFRVEEKRDAVGVHGFQVEVDSSLETGGLYETGGRGWVVQPDPDRFKKHYTPGQWSDLRLYAKEGHIVVHINGYKTAELKDDPGRSKGHIALQLHGGQDMHVQYKEIYIRAFSDE